MSAPTPFLDATEAHRAALRTAVAAVDAFIVHLPRSHPGPDRGLHAAWGSLVSLLALGSPPQLRTCPRCGHAGLRAATRCGHCWAPLDPGDPPESPVDAQEAPGGGAES